MSHNRRSTAPDATVACMRNQIVNVSDARRMACAWCLGAFTYHVRGGRPRKFCTASCRNAYNSCATKLRKEGAAARAAYFVGRPHRKEASAAQLAAQYPEGES